MPTYQTPGVYKEDVFVTPPPEFSTGVPAFLGLAAGGDVNLPQELNLWPQFEQRFGPPPANSYLAGAVRGFFENGGSLCYVVRLDPADTALSSLRRGLEALAPLDAIDLVCAPDLIRWYTQAQLPPLDELDPLWKQYLERRLIRGSVAPNPGEVLAMQAAVLEHCYRSGDRFAILDALPGAVEAEALAQRQGLNSPNGSLYFPWVGKQDSQGQLQYIPPCGHVAGVYARSDRQTGVHKTPANEALLGVVDLELNLTKAQQGRLNHQNINCLRAFPGRGIRVWGGRTLSDDLAWRYVSSRRLFLTAGRWIERHLPGVVYEPHDARLWARVRRELTAYFNDLFQRGALKGRTPEQAFYVKCDAETNPAVVMEAGQLVTEIGLAPAVPNEFVVVRLIHGASGVSIDGPIRP